MKILIPPLLCLISSGAWAALVLCPNQLECVTGVSGSYTFDTKDAEYCCPGSEQDVSTCTCPDGWSCLLDNKTCRRSSTSTSDMFGYYTQTYGTCDATITTEKQQCWKASLTETSNNCVLRMRESLVGGL